MMQGYVSPPRPRSVHAPLSYRVIWRDGGWCVAMNGCATRPQADRRRAESVARALQAEADGLRHVSPARGGVR